MSIPKTIQILTNLNCNLDCTYCYEEKQDRVNDIDSIKRFIEKQFAELGDFKGEVFVEIIGGEPFLYPELLGDITEFTLGLARKHNRCLFFSLSTNGTLFDNEKVRDFVEKYGRFYEFGVSIDGKKEVHDKYRRYKGGEKGSYDVIIPHLPWLFKHVRSVGAKATLSEETMFDLSDSVIHLIELGFRSIGSNPTYESPISLEDGERLALELIKIVDYVVDNKLEKKIKHYQLGDPDSNKGFLMALLSPPEEERNYCGSGEYMRCLGFDDEVFGCNRFCTMNKPDMTIDQEGLREDIKSQYLKWPKECLECNLKFMCPSCAAASYEEGKTPEEYFGEKRMCGWTYALAIAKLYYGSLLLRREKTVSENI